MNYFVKTYFVTTILFLFSACNNNDELELSKQKESLNAHEIDFVRINQKKEIDSLRNTISLLKEKKTNLLSENKINLLEAEIYSILKKSYFDHVIIGTKNIDLLSKLFSTKLGFVLKKGRLHKKGISNNFIEFGNNSEIEFITVNNPSDKLAQEYLSIIGDKTKALQFAVRVAEINKLNTSFNKLKSNFTEISNNSTYSILSTPSINLELPLFFIQYKQDNNNALTIHPNKSKGISAIWFATKDIKKTAKNLTDFGFGAIEKITIDGISGRKILFKNDNFQIILIESNIYEIKGISINVEDIKLLKSMLSNNFTSEFRTIKTDGKQSIFLSPNYTKSIWIEFFEQTLK